MRTSHFALLFFILGLATGVAAFTLPNSPTGSLIDVTFLVAVAAFLICILQAMTRRMTDDLREDSDMNPLQDPGETPAPHHRLTHGGAARREGAVRSHQHARQTTPHDLE